MSSQWSLPFRLPNQNFVGIYHLFRAFYMLRWSLRLPVTSSPFGSDILLTDLALSVFLPLCEGSGSTPIQSNMWNYSFVHFNLYVFDRRQGDRMFGTA
jgi:hypothetical protein